MWQIEREKRMQEIAKKKIELARIKEQNEMFAQIERKKKLEVEAISEIVQKQTNDNVELLHRALKRGDVLEKAVFSKNGEFDEQKQGLYADINMYGAQTEKQKKVKDQLFDDLAKIREKDVEVESKERFEKLAELKKQLAEKKH